MMTSTLGCVYIDSQFMKSADYPFFYERTQKEKSIVYYFLVNHYCLSNMGHCWDLLSALIHTLLFPPHHCSK